jgi:hypothetical protein
MDARGTRFDVSWCDQENHRVVRPGSPSSDMPRTVWSVDRFRCESLILKTHWVPEISNGSYVTAVITTIMAGSMRH